MSTVLGTPPPPRVLDHRQCCFCGLTMSGISEDVERAHIPYFTFDHTGYPPGGHVMRINAGLLVRVVPLVCAHHTVTGQGVLWASFTRRSLPTSAEVARRGGIYALEAVNQTIAGRYAPHYAAMIAALPDLIASSTSKRIND